MAIVTTEKLLEASGLLAHRAVITMKIRLKTGLLFHPSARLCDASQARQSYVLIFIHNSILAGLGVQVRSFVTC